MVVDVDYPAFFCCNCFNRNNGGALRPVQFPPALERLEIERLLLERPVNDVAGITDSDRAASAQAILYKDMPNGQTVGVLREWLPGETVEELREQNKLVAQWKNEIKVK